MDYVVFKKEMKLDDEVLFKKGKKYKILDTIDGKYAVSYGGKRWFECCLVPIDWDGYTLTSK